MVGADSNFVKRYFVKAKHIIIRHCETQSKQSIKKSVFSQGAQQKAIEDAKSFYANGVSIELIAKSLGMTEEQVQEIVKDVEPVAVTG